MKFLTMIALTLALGLTGPKIAVAQGIGPTNNAPPEYCGKTSEVWVLFRINMLNGQAALLGEASWIKWDIGRATLADQTVAKAVEDSTGLMTISFPMHPEYGKAWFVQSKVRCIYLVREPPYTYVFGSRTAVINASH
jgi:hypothetical protein